MSRSALRWNSGLVLVVGGALLATGPAAAAAETPKARAAALQAVVDCRKITDGPQRLACFDSASAQLDAAEQAGDVVVVDRTQVREARRAAFGFNFRMPSFMTGGGGEESKADAVEDVDVFESTVETARQNNAGQWTFRLPDGAVWIQTDTLVIRAKPGSKVLIRKAALGSYFLSVDGQRSVRAKRQN